MTNIREINISWCSFSSIPNCFSTLTRLRELYFHNNKVSHIPEFFTRFSDLYTAQLNDNQILSLPDNFFDKYETAALYLDKNKLSSLPSSITRLRSLEGLNLRGNLFSSLPHNLFNNFTALRMLWVYGKPALKVLPYSIMKVSTLSVLNHDDFAITKELPLPDVSRFPTLKEISGLFVIKNISIYLSDPFSSKYFTRSIS